MEALDVLASRFVHVVVLTAVCLVIIFLTGDLTREMRIFVGISPIAGWMLGKYYERSIILQAELIDSDELKELERSKTGILF